MSADFSHLDDVTLRRLAEDLRDGRLPFPPRPADLSRYVTGKHRRGLAELLAEAHAHGTNAAALAWSLTMVQRDRAALRARGAKVSSVWSGLDVEGHSQRALAVLRDLFSEARERVWISSYNIDPYRKSHAFFDELIDRHERGAIAVRFFLNIRRRQNQGGYTEEEIVANYSRYFRKNVWKSEVLPEVFYDPRALVDDGTTMSCLHAKAVMVDERKVLITSANFSEAAQIRNVEAGVLIEDALLTQAYCRNFQRLVDKKWVTRLPFEPA
ncbi:DISARM system phospholipase D-like protein DrmC [Acanthopleuribacter pedis]|uniref:phospholipase D n=1 Tax=Acanthopleuribacter pedis TaxID=442870 RepID=A0A8J7U925_9BACT|nr:DISARM system phospholipase D-like protein DrmC [Acanthopleuribacter pedis]MBO1323211.1 DISARM system phospholipase D-like protein DrmC [Acanthopleuribacter pedis]